MVVSLTRSTKPEHKSLLQTPGDKEGILKSHKSEALNVACPAGVGPENECFLLTQAAKETLLPVTFLYVNPTIV